MYEWLLWMSLSESPNQGRFSTKEECQFIANTHLKDLAGYGRDASTENFKEKTHCIRVQKHLKDCK